MTLRQQLLEMTKLWLRPNRPLPDAVASLDQVEMPPGLELHLAIVVVRRDPEIRLRTLAQGAFKLRALDDQEHGVLYEYQYPSPDSDDDLSSLLRITRLPSSPVAILTAVATRKEWRTHTSRLIDSLAPWVYRPFLRQGDLRTVFRNLQTSLAPERRVRFIRASSVRRLLSQARRKYESAVVWTDVDFEEAIQEASDDHMYFKKVAFEVCRLEAPDEISSTGLEGYVSRDAHFSSNAKFQWLYNAVVAPATERAFNDYVLYRSRGSLGSRSPSPLTILAEFQEEVIVERQDLRRIAEMLRQIPRTAVSILHGNPYLHATVVDLHDGSAFDLILASERRMLIVPQLRATEGALTRICRFVYEEIGEAEFKDGRSFI